jgi:single-stranded-DNA-specific exonuclease
MRWIYTPLRPEAVAELSREAEVSPVVAELLLRAGFSDPAAAARFLRPTLAELADPFRLDQLDAAARRLRQAIVGREEVVVLGDYDVDGVSSTALLVSVLLVSRKAPSSISNE